MIALGAILVPIAAVVLILHVVYSSSAVRRVLEYPPFVYIGRISYGIYLFHAPIAFYLASRVGTNPIARLLFFVPAIIVFASASYFFVERPFLRWKYSKRAAPASPPDTTRDAAGTPE
jgi:peptidoglycan/LPS O-acetylase OafA/YrhL